MYLRSVSILFSAVSLIGTERLFVNAQLPYHEPVLDRQGKLLAWYEPEKNLGYDHVLRLGWDFIEHKVPVDTRTKTGLKIYLINSVFDNDTLQGVNWQHNPAMVYAAFVDGLIGWYPYSSDEEAIKAVREMLDYQLAHGTHRPTGTGLLCLSQRPATTRQTTGIAFRICPRNFMEASRPTK